jgi:hypothetical protein
MRRFHRAACPTLLVADRRVKQATPTQPYASVWERSRSFRKRGIRVVTPVPGASEVTGGDRGHPGFIPRPANSRVHEP